ncbi:hypothetical protein PRIPAC_93481 [Pristionchus pacificus]|uniref:BTB domain-containing protein n=1 Tax=Pristionchus pacificus TaxID=54126 RepID=A0A2A6BQZ7_PRIPA|nr:hypothetical protein PRIPAC_93481 [Pristionchus pacificus]|eukprot:PDM68315.1 BTB domain-containing protein [Pristionchus pacificus]
MANDLVIRLDIEDALVLKDTSIDTKKFFAKGLHWKLRAKTENSDRTGNEEKLSVYLFCNWESENPDWICDWTTEFVLINSDNTKHVTNTLEYQCKFDDSHRGFFGILKWSSVIDEKEGFLVNGGLKVEARIRANKVAGMRISNRMDFSTPIDNISNIVLLVEGRRLHVSKQILSMCSPVFYSLFFGGFNETSKEEVEIKEVDYDQFLDFLNVLHPTTFTEILKRTVPYILALADRFQVDTVLEKAESYLIASKEFETAEKLAFADKFRLNILLARFFHALSEHVFLCGCSSQARGTLTTKQFKSFSSDTKAAICERLMELANKKASAES